MQYFPGFLPKVGFLHKNAKVPNIIHNRGKDAEGPKMPKAEGTRCAGGVGRAEGVRRAEGTWCAEGDRCTEGTVKKITASSQPRDSADPCVIRSRIAAPKEECPGSVQKGGGKAKYCVWSDAGDNSTTLR